MRLMASALVAVLLIAFPIAEARSEPALALRGEGYVGFSRLHVESSLAEGSEEVFQGGGAGSASATFGALYVQGDVFGDVTDYDPGGLETLGGAVGLGWREASSGSLGLVGTYSRQDEDIDHWRAGVEGELYLDRLTLAATGVYAEIYDGDGTGHVEGALAVYPTDRARLRVRGGVLSLEEDDPVGLVGASGEVLVAEPLGLFARWEGAFLESSLDIAQNSLVFGARLYQGADEPSLLVYDREHFKDSCDGFLFLGRGC